MQLALIPGTIAPRRPAIRYFGSKWLLSPDIIRHFPAHSTYTEPFGGSASTLLQKYPAVVEIYSDLNPGTVNFFEVVKANPAALVNALDQTPKTRDEFYGCFESHPDPIEWARRYACLGWGGFVGAGGRWSGGCSDARLQRIRQMSWQFLFEVSARLQQVSLEHRDAVAVMQSYDGPQTLHYVDPPYPAQARKGRDNRRHNSAPRRQYACEMLDDESHRQLAAVLRTLSGAVVLSGRNCPLYAELFGDWRRIDLPTRDGDRTAVVESIWLKEASA